MHANKIALITYTVRSQYPSKNKISASDSADYTHQLIDMGMPWDVFCKL